jgi:putative Mg2+ transporter-C (MgtC) family protein
VPATVDWPDIVLRLVLAVLAGGLLGFNRMERGMAAGLRTTLLVCLAAATSMIQVNLLLNTAGRAQDSFIMMDLMRLPLGILTGMGFIGGGAILRRGDMVTGITTAATLWLATVLGLCFGGGQYTLGLATWGFGVFALWGLKWLELRIKQDRRGRFTIVIAEGLADEEIQSELESSGYSVTSWAAVYQHKGSGCRRKISGEALWHGRITDARTPEFVRRLAERQGVLSVRWRV